MKFLIILIIPFLSINLFSQELKINKSDLFGCWTDSREENDLQTTICVYRPCNFKEFPLSRFRFKMDLRNDFTCSWNYLAPNDAHSMQEGTWTYNEEKTELIITNSEGEQVEKFVVEQVEKDLLKIKK
ncbi:MAG: hypothetical protein WCX31_08565 [Salinivirgaceae bacterium]|jgi:hypothetical protein